MRLQDVRPGDEELRLMLEAGFVLREANRLDDAESIFRGVIEVLPDSDVPRVALGTGELPRGRCAAAQAACADALRLDPGSLYARVHHAEALLFQQKRDEAEGELNEIIASDPESPHSRTARALLDAADMISARGPDAEGAV